MPLHFPLQLGIQCFFSAPPPVKQLPLNESTRNHPQEKEQITPKVPPPPPQNLPTAPPPPPQGSFINRAPPPSGNLLSELQNKSLRPTVTANAKPVDARSTLLEGIKHGIALRSAKDRQVETQQPTTKQAAPSSVAEILARRIAIQGSDDEEDEDDDAEWDQ